MNAIAILKSNRRYAILASTALVTILAFSGAQAGNVEQPVKQPQQIPVSVQAPAPATAKPQHHWYQIGRASWYGKLFQGHQTASGEDFDMNGLTCAHRSLPMGALVRVTNLTNHRSVVVRVNDRGPVPDNRVIDLSYAAAHLLGFNGTAKVRLELVDKKLSDGTAQLAQLLFPLDSKF